MHIHWRPEEVASVDAVNNALLVGSRQGTLYLATDPPVEAHLKNEAQLTALFAISETLAMVFNDRGQGRTGACVYRCPELQTISGMTFYDVTGGMQFHSHGESMAIVFTPAALRLIRFNVDASPKAKVVKTIEVKGVVAGCMSPEINSLLIATKSEYQLVDLSRGSRIPLFPILNDLDPVMASVGPDFIVVQGTGRNEPAMGLFVDKAGEVARSGAIVEWPAYPQDLAIWDNTVFAICNNELIMHAIVEKDGTSIERLDGSGADGGGANGGGADGSNNADQTADRIFKLSNPAYFVHPEVQARLGDPGLSEVGTHIAFMRGHSIDLYKPRPALLHFEELIRAGKCSQVLDNFPATPSGTAQYSYLCALLTLVQLKQGRNPKRNALPTDLVLYIYGHRPSFDVRPGMRDIVDELREASLNKDFLISVLRSEIRELRPASANAPKLRQLEPLYARLLLETDGDITWFMLEKGQQSLAEIVQQLREDGRFDELRHYFLLTNQLDKLNELNLEVIRNPKTPDLREAANQLVEYALSGDHWEIAMELLQNPRIDDSVGIKVLTSSQFEDKYDPATILDVLKEHTQSGQAWRTFLKHLVHTRGLFKDDLVVLIVTDLIEMLEVHGDMRERLHVSYADFARQSWPKPSYKAWIRSEPEYPAPVLKLQTELWDLMEKDLDWVSLFSTFEAQLADLKLERAIIYTRLGFYDRALQTFCEFTDYRSVIDFPTWFNDSAIQADMALMAFSTILDITDVHQNQILREFLSLPAAGHLSLDQVVDSLADTRPFYAVAEFVQNKVYEQEERESDAQRRYALAKANL